MPNIFERFFHVLFGLNEEDSQSEQINEKIESQQLLTQNDAEHLDLLDDGDLNNGSTDLIDDGEYNDSQ
jgi:hypothetical protein